MKPFYMAQNGWEDLTPAAYGRIAGRYAVPEAKIRAIVEVEAAGKGFHSSGALTALYEPHIAWRLSSDPIRAKLYRAGVAYPNWKRSYPKSSYPRIDACARIAGIELASRSTSWGLPQVMGFNSDRCGYPSAEAMVRAFTTSEEVQINAMIEFIKSSPRMWEA